MRRALAAPMPLAPPVIRATRPSKSVSVIGSVYSSRPPAGALLPPRARRQLAVRPWIRCSTYPLGERRPELVATPAGTPLAEVTLEGLRAGRVSPDELRATPETLAAPGAVARAAGRAAAGREPGARGRAGLAARRRGARRLHGAAAAPRDGRRARGDRPAPLRCRCAALRRVRARGRRRDGRARPAEECRSERRARAASASGCAPRRRSAARR